MRFMPGPNPDQMNQNLRVEWGAPVLCKSPPVYYDVQRGVTISLPSAILFPIAFPVLLYSLLSGEKHCILNNEIVQ